jgi:hypothetical protein
LYLGSEIIEIKAWDVSELKIGLAAIGAMAFVGVKVKLHDRAEGADVNGRA